MPSGITAALYEGEQSLRDYLMGVGRVMGYAIHQREEGNGPVTRSEPESWYVKRLADATVAYADALAMTPAEAAEKGRAEHEKREAEKAEGRAKCEAIKARYEEMIQQVEAWQPHPLMLTTKEEALRQLRDSMEFDFGGSYYEPAPMPERTPEQWRAHYVEIARLAVDDYRLNAEKEAQRNAERAAYQDAFFESLPPAEVAA